MHKISLLYVDDEPGLLEIGKTFLEHSGGFTVTTLESAGRALDALRTETYDAIVSDFLMPGMDGIEFLKTLRDAGNPVPFILFTGRGREEVVIAAINNGADFYLQKGGDPVVQFAELSHKIRIAVERRKTARALQESEEKYRTLIDLAPLAVIVYRGGKIVYTNPEAARLAGAETPADLAGTDFLPLFPPDELRRMEKYFRQLGRGETVPLIEIRLIRPDGQPFMVEAAAKPIVYEGQPSVMVVCRDITEKKKQDEDLRESRERLEAFMESATDAFTIWDADLNLVDINRAGLSFLPPGMKKEEIIGHNIAEFVTGTDEWGRIERYRDVIRTGIPFDGTGKNPMPRFGHRWVDVSCFRVGSGLGIATRDVTRVKVAEDQLRDANARLAAAEEELRGENGRKITQGERETPQQHRLEQNGGPDAARKNEGIHCRDDG